MIKTNYLVPILLALLAFIVFTFTFKVDAAVIILIFIIPFAAISYFYYDHYKFERKQRKLIKTFRLLLDNNFEEILTFILNLKEGSTIYVSNELYDILKETDIIDTYQLIIDCDRTDNEYGTVPKSDIINNVDNFFEYE